MLMPMKLMMLMMALMGADSTICCWFGTQRWPLQQRVTDGGEDHVGLIRGAGGGAWGGFRSDPTWSTRRIRFIKPDVLCHIYTSDIRLRIMRNVTTICAMTTSCHYPGDPGSVMWAPGGPPFILASCHCQGEVWHVLPMWVRFFRTHVNWWRMFNSWTIMWLLF